LVFFRFVFLSSGEEEKNRYWLYNKNYIGGFLDLFDERSVAHSNDASCGDSFPVTSVKNLGTACTIRRFKVKEQNRY
jgi:hypothetical protein